MSPASKPLYDASVYGGTAVTSTLSQWMKCQIIDQTPLNLTGNQPGPTYASVHDSTTWYTAVAF